MAFLPLIDWPNELIEQRLSFLADASRFDPPRDERDPRRGADGDGGRVTDVRALLAAADLALATGRSSAGFESLASAVDALVHRGDLLMATLPGAIVGRVSAAIEDSRIEVVDGITETRSVVESLPPSPSSHELLCDLVFAAITRAAPMDWAVQDEKEPPWMLGFGDPLFQALVAFESDGGWRAAQAGLIANSALWADRLGRFKRDEHHWSRGRIGGRLVDLRRLAFEIALRVRDDGRGFREWYRQQSADTLVGAIDRFAADLAAEIVERRRT